MQVAASTNKEVDGHIPNYPNLPPQLICQLHNVTMHVSLDLFVTSALNNFVGWLLQLCDVQADVETDEVYAQMTLQPLSPVLHFSLSGIMRVLVLFYLSCCNINYFVARAKRSIPTACRIGYSQQTAKQLFL